MGKEGRKKKYITKMAQVTPPENQSPAKICFSTKKWGGVATLSTLSSFFNITIFSNFKKRRKIERVKL